MAEIFQADCENCLGLCCIALRFNRADGFGHDKSAGDPCFYLDARHRCRIHDRREDLGYEGCIDFDCLGAGQRASASLSAEERTNPAAIAGVQTRLRILMAIQELRQALTEAGALDLAAPDHARRQTLLTQFAAFADDPKADLHESRVDPVLDSARALIRSWRDERQGAPSRS
jgi:hypothetical protein